MFPKLKAERFWILGIICHIFVPCHLVDSGKWL